MRQQVTVAQELPAFERAVLTAVHNAPWVEPERQPFNVQRALDVLAQRGLIGPSCLKDGAYESTEEGARLLGYA